MGIPWRYFSMPPGRGPLSLVTGRNACPTDLAPVPWPMIPGPCLSCGAFGLKLGGWKFTLYLLLINLPYGIVTAVVARAIIGEQP